MILDFTTLVRNQITAMQALCHQFINFSVGSVLRAFVESNISQVLWLQNLILQALALSRASTCNDSDLDSWMADFGHVRIDAVAATGVVTFARFTPALQAIVPVGTIVELVDGSVQYIVSLDSSDPNYNDTFQGYVIQPNVTSIDVPVTCLTRGLSGNAEANMITRMTESIPGVDTVTNRADFENGLDTEDDDDFRARFIVALASLRKATKNAVAGAVAAVRPGLTYNIIENYNIDGTPNDGYFYVVVDDGTGAPNDDLIGEVSSAVDDARPLTSKFDVIGPQIQRTDVNMTIVTPVGQDHAAIATEVTTAISNYISGLGLGNSLSYSALSKYVYDTVPNVSNILNFTINSGILDVVPASIVVLKPGTIVVN